MLLALPTQARRCGWYGPSSPFAVALVLALTTACGPSPAPESPASNPVASAATPSSDTSIPSILHPDEHSAVPTEDALVVRELGDSLGIPDLIEAIEGLCDERAPCALDGISPSNRGAIVELVLEPGDNCTNRELWLIQAPDVGRLNEPRILKQTCTLTGVLDRMPLAGPTTASSAPSAPTTTHTTGPGWVKLEYPTQAQLAFSANGRWVTSGFDNGVLVAKSDDWTPLAFVPTGESDRPLGLVFHPRSTHLVAALEVETGVWSITDHQSYLQLVEDGFLPASPSPGLVPPVFHHTGRYLAVSDYDGSLVFDFPNRKAISYVATYFALSPAAMRFRADTLSFVEGTTGPCQCDDFGGSDAAIVAWNVGSRSARHIDVAGDLIGPLSLRGQRISTPSGIWNVLDGRREQSWKAPADPVAYLQRLRVAKGAVGIAYPSGKSPYAILLHDSGQQQRLATLDQEPPQGFAARPQDDFAVYLAGRQPVKAYLVPLNGDPVQTIPLPERICVDSTAVVPDARCKNAPLHHAPAQPKSPELSLENVPLVHPPDPQPPPPSAVPRSRHPSPLLEETDYD